jgi:fumarate reductase subunit C
LAKEFEYPFYPAHELREETVVVRVDFVNEFVEVVFVSLAEVDESLDGLIGVCGNILFLAFVDDLGCISLDLFRR